MKLKSLLEINATQGFFNADRLREFGISALKDHVRSYIKTNSEADLRMIQNLCHRNGPFAELVDKEYIHDGVFFRGICGTGDKPSIDTVIGLEKQAMFKSVTKDYAVAMRYANQGACTWKYIITYKVPSNGIVLDIDLFNLLYNCDIENESEAIIDIHACRYMDVKEI